MGEGLYLSGRVLPGGSGRASLASLMNGNPLKGKVRMPLEHLQRSFEFCRAWLSSVKMLGQPYWVSLQNKGPNVSLVVLEPLCVNLLLFPGLTATTSC